MSDFKKIKSLLIDGESLTLEGFIAVSRYHAKVELAPAAKKKMETSYKLTKKIVQTKRVAYGITTGFGDFANVAVPEQLSNKLSTNLVLSHCTATGNPYSEEQVRGMMLLRANALCGGVSGVRPLLVITIIEMLNKNVVPYIPEKGSLGASGDLAPLSHMGLVMLGKGKAYYKGQLMSGKEAMEKAGVKSLRNLVSKEGLGITNGTCAMTSVGALNLYDTINAAKMADLIASMTFTALLGQKSAFDERLHKARGQKGQMQVAANFRVLTDKNPLLQAAQGDRVQDAYALRCIPQVHGSVRDTLEYVKEKVEIELNAVTDNPLIFPEDEAVISGGNFHGEPMALPFDFLGIACAEIASISERRIERMVNEDLSNGLTPFLTTKGGVNSGYMIVQYSAASMVSENKVLAHPACVDSITSSANQEDFVSMGTTAARKAKQILENTLSVLAFELLTATQALDIRLMQSKEKKLSPIAKKTYAIVREKVRFMKEDRELWPDIEQVESIVRSTALIELLDELKGFE